ncbi:hypothetical protein [Actinophytocola sediminis]
MSDDDDPARGFLDQTVPKDDVWAGREPEDGPARPRHVAYPSEPDSMRTAKERRKDTIRNAAWTFGPSVAYLAGSAAFAGSASAAEPEPEPDIDLDMGGVGEIGSGF